MSTTASLVDALKAELKSRGMTYAQVAAGLGMAESSIKRLFAQKDMPLSRVDEVLKLLQMDFVDLARKLVDAQPERRELTLDQERAVMADRHLLLLVACCLSQWSVEEIVSTYRITEAEVIRGLARLDRLDVIELKPGNRYRLKVAKTFRWHPQGPVMKFFRETLAPDFFDGGFAADGERLMMIHGQLGASAVQAFGSRLERIAEDFAQQHLVDRKLPQEQRRPFTLVVGMRSWLFSAFKDMRREKGSSALPVRRGS